MIPGLDLNEFVRILHTHLSPTAPIQSEQHLFGRTKQLEAVFQALHAPGRSIFIYGDRGVGKTSLAQTVAFSAQGVSHDPVFLACTPHDTFAGLMADMLSKLAAPDPKTSQTTHTAKLGFKGLGLELSRKQDLSAPAVREELNLNRITARLLEIAARRSNESAVVVVDEFDRITREEERGQFADFIKQIGDQRIGIKFVFCGVTQSMEALLGAHGSCYRYLEGVELKGLSWDARFEIIDAAASALGIRVDSHPRFRIAAISDGFPYYVHRMCEALFWQMFKNEGVCTVPTIDHFRAAVAEAVVGIEQHLKRTYEQAVMKDAPGYEQVLWAMADHADLIRNIESIYDSYVRLFDEEDSDDVVLDRPTVVARLNALKTTSCGQMLASERKKWYHFRENIMRGYVRLRAEEQGYELALDYSGASNSGTALIWRPRGARRTRKDTRRREWDQ
jgi:uncharacterized protein